MLISSRRRLELKTILYELHTTGRNSKHNAVSLSYIWVEQVASSVLEQDPGAQLAKIDIKSTYRKVLIHSDDCPSPGTCICTLYAVEQPPNVDAASPFGLCSASIVYTSSMQSQMSSSGLLSTWA